MGEEGLVRVYSKTLFKKKDKPQKQIKSEEYIAIELFCLKEEILEGQKAFKSFLYT